MLTTRLQFLLQIIMFFIAGLSTLKSNCIFFREVQKEGDVIQLSCRTNDQITDVLTKALSEANFEELRSKLGVCCCC